MSAARAPKGLFEDAAPRPLADKLRPQRQMRDPRIRREQ